MTPYVDGRTLVPDISGALQTILGIVPQIQAQQKQKQVNQYIDQAMSAPADERMKSIGMLAKVAGPETAAGIMGILNSQDQSKIGELKENAARRRKYATIMRGIEDPKERKIYLARTIEELRQEGKPIDKFIGLANLDQNQQNLTLSQWMLGDKQVEALADQAIGINNDKNKTSLMKNVEAMGLQPGTPEYIEAVKQAINKPATQVNIGDASKSIAKEVGPILDESRVKTSGAVSTYKDADNILNALDKGDIIAGPGATLRMSAAQVAQMFGYKGDGAIERTRQVIRSLANTSVEARKRLAGQGQVTENEAKAVEKAQSGDISDLTVDEIKLLAELNKKDAHFTVMQHEDLLNAIPESDAGLKKFYQVRGTDALMKESKGRGLPVENPGKEPEKVEAEKTIGGKKYIKMNGKWYEAGN